MINRLKDFLYTGNSNLKRIIMTAIGVAVIIIVVLIFSFMIKGSGYSGYEIITSKEDSDSSLRYESFNKYVISYSENGVSLLNDDLERVWNYSYTYTVPVVEKCEDCFIIYDKGSQGISVYGPKGRLGEFSASKNVLKAKCASNGCVIVLQSDDTETSIKYLNSSGGELAVISYNLSEDGFPLDFDVSEDGNSIAVSLEKITENGLVTDVAFYDFTNDAAGSVSEARTLSFNDELVPVLISGYGNNVFAAFTESFSVFDEGDLSVQYEEKFDSDIISFFNTEENAGFLFKDKSSDGHKIVIYDLNGKQINEIVTDFVYNNISYDSNGIYLYNKKEFEVYDWKGTSKLKSEVEEGSIRGLAGISGGRYLLVLDSGTAVIKGTGMRS